MSDLKNALWCDLTTDAERSAWLLLGRGHETGVVAKSIQNDLARAYQRLSKTEPQREWVGLTDEEIRNIATQGRTDFSRPPYEEYYIAIEQALKEKNT